MKNIFNINNRIKINCLICKIFIFSLFFVIMGEKAYGAIPPKACGTVMVHYTISSPTTVSTLAMSGLMNKYLEVNADLIIDIPFYFQNCWLRIAPGVKIIVNTDGQVNFFECNLFNCGAMNQKWYGIEVNQPATIPTAVQLHIVSCIIENATYGVKLDNQKNVWFLIKNNDFYNNFIGIHIMNGTEFDAHYIWGNKFHGDAVSFAHGTPAFTSIPAYGIKIDGDNEIEVNYLNVNIGENIDDLYPRHNDFYDLYIAGIYMNLANVDVKGCVFHDFRLIPSSAMSPYTLVTGIGILAVDSYLIVKNNIPGEYKTISFSNLDYGMYCQQALQSSSTEVFDAYFTSCASWAWYNKYPGGGDVYSLRNSFNQTQDAAHTFYTTRRKFQCIGIDGNGTAEIGNNYFYSDYVYGTTCTPLSHQIYINALGGGSINTAQLIEIYENYFYNSMDQGISNYFTNILGTALIYDNVYDNLPFPKNTTTKPLWELGIVDCQGFRVRRNEFQNDLMTDAVHVEGVNKTLFCQNNMGVSDYSLHAVRDSKIDFAKNSIGVNINGIFLDWVSGVEPVIGPQKYKENTWGPLTNYSIWGAKNEASTTPNVLASLFTVDPAVLNQAPPSYTPYFWFSFSPNTGLGNACEDQWQAELVFNGDESLLSWESKYQYYGEIAERSPLNDDEVNLMENVENTSIPALYILEKNIGEALTTSDEDREAVDLYRATIREARSAINAIMVNYPDGNVQGSDEDLVNEYLDVIETATQSLSETSISIKTNRISNLQNLLNEVNNLDVNANEETTYKNYLKLVINVGLNGKDDSENVAISCSLSDLDYLSYGPGSRKANHFLPEDLYETYINKIAENCQNGSEEMYSPHQNSYVAKESNWEINKVEIRTYNLTTSSKENSIYNLYSMNGQLMLSGTIFEGDNMIDVSSLKTGFYIIKNLNDNKVQKLYLEPLK